MVEGMEEIIATVSGYHGSQRLKLVKLINAVGANYVGTLSKSTTHLVCWKFKGEKYELAKEFGTIIVNHQWFEDCMKEGKRIPEHPYTLISGQSAGSMRSQSSLVMDQPGMLNENKLILNQQSTHDLIKHVIDLDSDEIENDDSYDELLLDENLFNKPGRITTGRQKFKRKEVKGTSKGDWRAKIDNIKSSDKIVLHIDDVFQSEKFLPNRSNKHRRRNADINMGTNCGELSRRSCRLLKKNAESCTSGLATNSTELLQRKTLANRNRSQPSLIQSNDSVELREGIEASISSRHVATSSALGESKHKTNQLNDISVLGDTGVQSHDLLVADKRDMHEITSTCQNMERQLENKDVADIVSGLEKSVEPSCVICWTEFSSTRGVLPCGHRFCFTCIEHWADQMCLNKKETTCPLCKASFASITRVDGTTILDQKSYSQSIPIASSQDIFIVPEVGPISSTSQTLASDPDLNPPVCCRCQSPYPAELLVCCRLCQTSRIHTYCIDPFHLPWTCFTCRNRRLFY